MELEVNGSSALDNSGGGGLLLLRPFRRKQSHFADGTMLTQLVIISTLLTRFNKHLGRCRFRKGVLRRVA